MNTETEKGNAGTALAKVTPGAVAVPDVANVRALAKELLESGLFQGVRNVAGAVTIIQAGIELGMPPVASLNSMVIINGRLAMEAKLLLAVAHQRAGVTWKITREDDKGCEIIFSRPGWEDQVSTFTEAEAKTANLLGKTNWTLWKKDMYFARAAGRGVRRIAPDATLGFITKEEAQDSEGVDLNGDFKPEATSAAKAMLEEMREKIATAKTLPRVRDGMDPEAPLPGPRFGAETIVAPTPPADDAGSGATEQDPFDEAHHDTPERASEKQAQNPPVANCPLDLLNEIAKRIANLKALNIDEGKIYASMAKKVREKYGAEFAEVGELTPEMAKDCAAYLTRWEKAVKAEDAAKGQGAAR